MKKTASFFLTCLGALLSSCGSPAQQEASKLAVVADRSLTLIAAEHDERMLSCMNANGFEHTQLPTALLPIQTLFYRWPLSQTDLKVLRRDGFGLALLYENAEVIERDENRRYFDSLSSSDRIAYGKAQVQCSKAGVESAGKTEAAKASGRFSQLTKQVESQEQFGKLATGWSECMRTEGYSVQLWKDLEKMILEFSDHSGTTDSLKDPNPTGDGHTHTIDRSFEVKVAIAASDCWEPQLDEYVALIDGPRVRRGEALPHQLIDNDEKTRSTET